MTSKQITRLIKQCESYEAQLGEPLAALVKSDTGVLTTRMSDGERAIAQRLREAVQKLAGY